MAKDTYYWRPYSCLNIIQPILVEQGNTKRFINIFLGTAFWYHPYEGYLIEMEPFDAHISGFVNSSKISS